MFIILEAGSFTIVLRKPCLSLGLKIFGVNSMMSFVLKNYKLKTYPKKIYVYTHFI